MNDGRLFLLSLHRCLPVALFFYHVHIEDGQDRRLRSPLFPLARMMGTKKCARYRCFQITTRLHSSMFRILTCETTALTINATTIGLFSDHGYRKLSGMKRSKPTTDKLNILGLELVSPHCYSQLAEVAQFRETIFRAKVPHPKRLRQR
jgi:hypothetical protein